MDRYAEIFGVPPEFGAAETTMGFAPADFEAPLPQANEHTALFAQAQCRDLLDRRKARAGLSGQVRNLLLERIAYPPSAEQVAATLHLSSRTLRERLASEGTSFRALLDEVRERLAEEMLLRGLTVSQVSERLGYVEISSFSQAFRRWKGVGPREYRSHARI
jgi:AraC-like DNA-binding protein